MCKAYRKSPAISPAPSTMLFNIPIGIGLLPCIGTILADRWHGAISGGCLSG
jgi:hypothetical protein